MMKATNNTELKMELAKSVTRKTHYTNNSDSSVTIKVTDGYDHILREETYTREDMITLADRYTNKLVDKDAKKKRRDSLNENIKIFNEAVGGYVTTLTVLVMVTKGVAKLLGKFKK